MEAVDMDEVVGTDADEVVDDQTSIWAKLLAWLNATPPYSAAVLGPGRLSCMAQRSLQSRPH